MIKRPVFSKQTLLSVATILSCLLVGLSACKSGGSALRDSAAGTATALVQNAQSTALVLQAQAMATALVGTLNAPPQGPASHETATPSAMGATPIATLAVSQATPGGVEIVAVTTAADGAYIMVQFRAPARLARGWNQGVVAVVDESSGNEYTEIPSVGTIGPLISKPKQDGQLGFVMLTNAPVPMKPGDLVTVILGDFKQEHLVIQ
jgi:hypothetical protein